MVDESGVRTEGIGALIGGLSSQIMGLVRSEFALAQHEMRAKMLCVAAAAALGATAAFLAILGGVAALIVLIALLRYVAPLWAAALIAMAIVFAFAGIFAVGAQALFAKAQPLVPQRTRESLAKDITWLKTRIASKSE